jgi:phosphate transport system substrate-binding protein
MKYIFIALVVISITGCQTGNENKSFTAENPEGRIYISGAFALYPLAVKWADEFQKEYPGIKIDISAGGAGKGMTDVLSGMVDIAMVSREVHDDESKKGAWPIAVARDAVFPVINTQNPVYPIIKERGLKKEELALIYVTGKGNWKGLIGKDLNINLFTRSDACGAAEMWASYCGCKQEDLAGTGVFGDPGMAEAVKNDILGVGYNNLIFLYDISTGNCNQGLAPIPLDTDKNGILDSAENFYGNLATLKQAINEGKYPMPPARNLYLVCNKKPDEGPVKVFLEWVLTKGRAFIDEAGYVDLSEEVIGEEIKKLK